MYPINMILELVLITIIFDGGIVEIIDIDFGRFKGFA